MAKTDDEHENIRGSISGWTLEVENGKQIQDTNKIATLMIFAYSCHVRGSRINEGFSMQRYGFMTTGSTQEERYIITISTRREP